MQPSVTPLDFKKRDVYQHSHSLESAPTKASRCDITTGRANQRATNPQVRGTKPAQQSSRDLPPRPTELPSYVPDDARKTDCSFSQFTLCENGNIQTPGGRFQSMNRWLMAPDLEAMQRLHLQKPDKAAFYRYAQDIHDKWRDLEKSVEKDCFQLAYDAGSKLEIVRAQTVASLIRFFSRHNVKSPWVLHYAVINANRGLHHWIKNQQMKLTREALTGMFCACVRMALKHEECCKFNTMWNASSARANHGGILWKDLGFSAEIERSLNHQELAKVEFSMMEYLTDVLTPPSPRDFLERYVHVGQWPVETQTKALELGAFIVDLTLLTQKDFGLGGVLPSMLASAALMLAIKILGGSAICEAYECWPTRMEVYTGYTKDELSSTVKNLSQLLRHKPAEAVLLNEFHTHWGVQQWT